MWLSGGVDGDGEGLRGLRGESDLEVSMIRRSSWKGSAKETTPWRSLLTLQLSPPLKANPGDDSLPAGP